MTIHFTKIKYAGEDMIIITSNDLDWRKPILLLTKNDIKLLNQALKQND